MEPVAAPERRISRSELAGVVLAAGEGTRLRPLSHLLPKALCPIGNRALVDLALDRLVGVVGGLAVNTHHHADLLAAHLEREWSGAVTVSHEREVALGTAGAIARLRSWIDGRAVVIVNADGWSPSPLDDIVRSWDGDSIRVMVDGPSPFGPTSRIVASALPWNVVERLREHPTGLYEVVWKDAFDDGELEVVHHEGAFIDCGTPDAYLDANLSAVAAVEGSIIAEGVRIGASAIVESSAIGAGARIEGEVRDSVIWPGQVVAPGERLVRSIRAGTSVTIGPL